jgi:hypothetical protein
LIQALSKSLGVVERMTVDLQSPQDRESYVRVEAIWSNEAEAAVDWHVVAIVG